MGQYQQWLHYQEIDRRLHATLQVFEQEQAQLESLLEGLPHADPLAAKPIISALIAHMADNSNGHLSPQDNTDNFDPETISPALLHWSELPDFGPQEMKPSGQDNASSFLTADHIEIELLPDDMFAFFEEHTQTDPQLELPWWLRKITISNSEAESGKPIDQESMRTNRLVQRWVERWGRQSSSAFTPEDEIESEGIQDEE